jgi:transposase-like protein
MAERPADDRVLDGPSAERRLRSNRVGADEQPLVPLRSAVRRAACPYCGSSNTERKSEFGSTACKAIHYCADCRQPFEEFKAI